MASVYPILKCHDPGIQKERMKKAVERLREDIEALVTQAYQQDEVEEAALGSRRGDELPAELARREDRLATIEAAMQR